MAGHAQVLRVWCSPPPSGIACKGPAILRPPPAHRRAARSESKPPAGREKRLQKPKSEARAPAAVRLVLN